MSQGERVRLVIIGGGPAGFTAALYASRAGLHPVCIEGYESGGQIARSYRVENYPGLGKEMSGADLSARIREQAEEVGARFVFNDVTSVDLSERPFRVSTDEGSFLADAVIIATGSKARRLGLASELEYEGRGVAYCAVCDGPFFAGKDVAVVGGGDAALEEAFLLREVAASVTLIHRREDYRASAVLQDVLRRSPEIRTITPAVVTEVLGDANGMTGLRLRDVRDGTSSTISCEGLFVAIGHDPASTLFAPWVDRDEFGFIRREPFSTATNVPGVFVAGDVADRRYRQAITAAAAGCQAAIDVDRWMLAHGNDRCAPLPARPA